MGLDVGKGCIRFKKSKAVADTRIEEFIEKAMSMLRNGEEFPSPQCSHRLGTMANIGLQPSTAGVIMSRRG